MFQRKCVSQCNVTHCQSLANFCHPPQCPRGQQQKLVAYLELLLPCEPKSTKFPESVRIAEALESAAMSLAVSPLPRDTRIGESTTASFSEGLTCPLLLSPQP